MQPVLIQGSIDNPLTFDVGLIQLSFIPVCSTKIAQRVYTLVFFIGTLQRSGTILQEVEYKLYLTL